MATLKEIKDRIHSVQSTRKITSAMKMVSMAKLHKTERMIGHVHTYYHTLHDMLKVVLNDGKTYQNAFTEERELKKVALVVLSSNSNLCGSFNTNVAKKLEQVVQDYEALGKDNILIIPIGKKIAQATFKMGFRVAPEFMHLDSMIDNPDGEAIAQLSMQMKQLFVEKQVDKIELIYHHAKSKGSQVLELRTLLPLDLKVRDIIHSATVQDDPHKDYYIIEPDREAILKDLIPAIINIRLHLALLDSNVSEHTARMMAMQTATDNADELLDEIKLHYNKLRQQAITNELLDIIGGSID